MKSRVIRLGFSRMRPGRVIASALMVLGVTSTLATAQTGNLRLISVGIPEALKIDYAFLPFAKDLGYFADEGIDIKIVSLDGSGTLIPQVASKRIDVAFVNPGLLVLAASKKQPFPVKYFYNHYRSQVFQLITKADSPIRSISDLKGKKFGVPFLSGGEIPLVKLIFASAGVKWDDLEILPTGFGPAAWKRLASNEVDAVVFPVAEAERVAISGTPVRRLTLPEPFPRLFANGFIANDDTIKSDTKLLTGFGRAVAKGTTACIANIGACLQAYWRLDPNQKPATEEAQRKWLQDSKQLLGAIFDTALKLQSGQPDLWGNYPDGSWQQLLQTMRDGGQIANTDIDLSIIYSNSLVADINRFDRDAVKQRADKPL